MSTFARGRVRLWAAWVAISAGGQLLGLLVWWAAIDTAETWGAANPASPLQALLILTGPFVACGVGAVPQALLLRHRWAPVWGSVSTTAWTVVSALSGLHLLFIEYLLLSSSSPQRWSDVLVWYLPITAYVALLVTLLQAALLRGLLAMPRLFLYVPLTTLGWIVGWSSLIASQFGVALGLSGILAADPTLSFYLSFAVPLVTIAAASGLVLAAPLATKPRLLPEEVERRRRRLPFLLVNLTLVALAAVVFLVVLVTGLRA